MGYFDKIILWFIVSHLLSICFSVTRLCTEADPTHTHTPKQNKIHLPSLILVLYIIQTIMKIVIRVYIFLLFLKQINVRNGKYVKVTAIHLSSKFDDNLMTLTYFLNEMSPVTIKEN